MKRFLSLLAVGSFVAYLRARSRRAPGASAHGGDFRAAVEGLEHADHPAPAMASLDDGDGLAAQVGHMGLADVDPEGLIGMGEGIDLDGNAAAHRDIREQRDRLPKR